MSTTRRTDVAIVGAGISGLSLATRLKQENPNAKVTLVGPVDLRPQRISTWIDSREPISATVKSCIDKQWDTWGFRSNAGNLFTQKADTSHYAAIDGKRLKEEWEEYAKLLGIQRVYESCHNVQFIDAGLQLICESKTLGAMQLVDTRPPTIPDTTVKQQFVGHIIRCKTPHRHKVPVLMDFTASPIANDGITFIYALPLSDYDLLIEATTFSPMLHVMPDYETCIKHWIDINLPANTSWTHIETESGILPMGPIEPIDKRLTRCGISGGAARASTGYAWHGTQRQVTQLAKRYADTSKLSKVIPYSHKARLMDTLFLRVLRHQPKAIYQLFMVMAQRLSGDTLAQFLCDEGGWTPCLRTILAAPKRPFVRALWRT